MPDTGRSVKGPDWRGERGEAAIRLVSWVMNSGIKYDVKPDIMTFISPGITLDVESEIRPDVKHEVVCEVATNVMRDVISVISGVVIVAIESDVTTNIAPEFIVEVAPGITQGMPPFAAMRVTRRLALYATIGMTILTAAIPTCIISSHAG